MNNQPQGQQGQGQQPQGQQGQYQQPTQPQYQQPMQGQYQQPMQGQFQQPMQPQYQQPNFVDRQKVDMYIMSNQKFFPAEQLMFIKEKLYALDDAKFSMVSMMELKDPTTMLIISLLLGSLGIDRFMLKETGMGVLKLLTAGCCGVLTIIDWFNVQKKTKDMNFKQFMSML